MNSIQKQSIGEQIPSHETMIVLYKKDLGLLKSIDEVELLLKKLQYLGLHFDPFQNEIENECKQIMDQFGLTPHMRNPYLATNILLRLLDLTEEKLNNLKQ